MSAYRRFQFRNHHGQLIYCNGRHTYVAQPGSASASRIPDDQQWYWTPEWQEGEREVDGALAAGDYETFGSDEAFLAWLTESEDA